MEGITHKTASSICFQIIFYFCVVKKALLALSKSKFNFPCEYAISFYMSPTLSNPTIFSPAPKHNEIKVLFFLLSLTFETK